VGDGVIQRFFGGVQFAGDTGDDFVAIHDLTPR